MLDEWGMAAWWWSWPWILFQVPFLLCLPSCQLSPQQMVIFFFTFAGRLPDFWFDISAKSTVLHSSRFSPAEPVTSSWCSAEHLAWEPTTSSFCCKQSDLLMPDLLSVCWLGDNAVYMNSFRNHIPRHLATVQASHCMFCKPSLFCGLMENWRRSCWHLEEFQPLEHCVKMAPGTIDQCALFFFK